MTARATTRFPDDILTDVDELVERGEFKTRSDAIRAGVKSLSGVDEPDEPGDIRQDSLQADGGTGLQKPLADAVYADLSEDPDIPDRCLMVSPRTWGAMVTTEYHLTDALRDRLDELPEYRCERHGTEFSTKYRVWRCVGDE